MTDEGPDDYTPRERGVLAGGQVAGWVADGEMLLADPDAVLTRGELLDYLVADPPRVPDVLRALVADNCDVAGGLAAEGARGAFWSGFRDGVRAFIGRNDPENN